MTNSEHPDGRDPIAAAFDDYQRPAADVVPRAHDLDDELAGVVALDELAGQTVTVTHYDMTPDGITQHVETATITAPITPKGTISDHDNR
ncbi:hypothetical protein AU189_11465 [Mycolicibacterium acapulense]|nr:hypothetical protein AU189_11465 [Mycolicibacterium acapulense]